MADQSRLDVVEGRVEELSRHWDRLFGEIGRLDQKIDTLGGALSARTDTLSSRIDALSARIDALDEKCDRRFDAVDSSSTSKRWNRRSIVDSKRSTGDSTICRLSYPSSFDGHSARCWRCWE